MSSEESVNMDAAVDAFLMPPPDSSTSEVQPRLENWPFLHIREQNTLLLEALAYEAQLFKQGVEDIIASGRLPNTSVKRALIAQLLLIIRVLNDCESS